METLIALFLERHKNILHRTFFTNRTTSLRRVDCQKGGNQKKSRFHQQRLSRSGLEREYRLDRAVTSARGSARRPPEEFASQECGSISSKPSIRPGPANCKRVSGLSQRNEWRDFSRQHLLA